MFDPKSEVQPKFGGPQPPKLRKSRNPHWSKPADPLQDLSPVSWTSDTSVSLRMKHRCQSARRAQTGRTFACLPPILFPLQPNQLPPSARVTTIRTRYRERVVDIDFIFPLSPQRRGDFDRGKGWTPPQDCRYLLDSLICRIQASTPGSP